MCWTISVFSTFLCAWLPFISDSTAGSLNSFSYSVISFGQVDVPVYTTGTGVKPAEIAKQGLQEAKRKNIDVVIMDTAGRLQVMSPIFSGIILLRSVFLLCSFSP